MLSEVERAVKNPTVKLAWQIARALGCSLTDLLDGESGTPVTIVRAAERKVLVDPETQVTRDGVVSALLRRLEVVRYVLPKGASSGAMAANRPGVLEHVVVMRGTLTFRLGGEDYRLEEGDHVTYGAQKEMEYRNEGTRSCEIMLLSDSSGAR